jgi:hypothetical protein
MLIEVEDEEKQWLLYEVLQQMIDERELNGYFTLVDSGKVVPIYVSLKDVYAVAIADTIVTATATNGALVNIGADSAGISSTGVSATVASDTYVRVDTPTAGLPLSTIVTVTFNGTTIGSSHG